MENRLKSETAVVLDVRKPSEFETEHIENAQLFPLSSINENLNEIDDETTYFVHCQGGYRSMIASSILKSRGYHNLIEIKGGFMAIQKTDITLKEFACSSKNK